MVERAGVFISREEIQRMDIGRFSRILNLELISQIVALDLTLNFSGTPEMSETDEIHRGCLIPCSTIDSV